MRARILACSLFAGLAVSVSSAQTPLGTAFTYQGQLETAAGPVNGLHDLRFRLYDALSGGAQVGASQCFDDVSLTDGLVTQSLDFGPQFNGQQRFLEIDVRADTGQDCTNASGFILLTPRQALTATPNALYAQSVPVPLTLSGTSATHIIRGENASTTIGASGVFGEVTGGAGNTYGVFGRNASATGRGVYGQATDASGVTFGVFGRSSSTSGHGVFGIANASTGITYGVYGESSSTEGRGVFGWAPASTGFTYGGRFESDSTSGRGVYGIANASTGTTYGGRFASISTDGRGVYGVASAATGTTYGVFGESASSSGCGVFGLANAATGITYGGRFESNSTSGHGVYGAGSASGVFGQAQAPSGKGVMGWAGSSGPNYGGHFVSFSPDGIGVLGLAFADTGTTSGVRGLSNSTSGRGVMGKSANNIGVYGYATSTSDTNYGVYGGSESTTGRGVNGVASASSGVNYGVRGATASASGWGVYSSGDFGASGTKAFRIDHPFDPENKYLLHYSSESPMPQNFYVGNVVTDAQGYAWIELPDYFQEINANFKYQLTVISDGEDFVQAMVSKKVQANRFQVRTSAPNVEVSWEIMADRNDLHVRHKQPRDVVEKQALERGTYQHPELYGQPPEKSVDYDAERDGISLPALPE